MLERVSVNIGAIAFIVILTINFLIRLGLGGLLNVFNTKKKV